MIHIRLGSSELSTAKSEQSKAIALSANVEQRKRLAGRGTSRKQKARAIRDKAYGNLRPSRG